ncbi:MAG: alpha/beta hydrolase [Bacteroidota bacterium]
MSGYILQPKTSLSSNNNMAPTPPKQASATRSFTLEVDGIQLAGIEWGAGDQTLLCLHGYRENKETWHTLLPDPPSGFRIISLDLPLDGESQIPRPVKPIQKAWFHLLWEALDKTFPHQAWHLAGYSQGGRWAVLLQRYVGYPAKQVFLLAPDGLQSHWGHQLVQGRIGQWILFPLLKRPGIIWGIATRLHRWQLLPASVMGMLRYVLRGPTASQHLLDTLVMQRDMPISGNWIKTSSGQVKWHILWGKRDGLVRNQAAVIRKLGPNIHYTPLDGSHDIPREQPTQLRTYIWQALQLDQIR